MTTDQHYTHAMSNEKDAPQWGLSKIGKLFNRHARTISRWIRMDAPEASVIHTASTGQHYAIPSEVAEFLRNQ